MLKKIKDFLGIEGVRIDLQIPESFNYDEGEFTGHILLNSMSDQTVNAVEISLIEKYKRGRKDSALINEYTLGSIVIKEKMLVKKEQELRIPFELKFVPMMSEMDKMEKDHFVFSAMVKTAKFFKGVKSTYRVEAKAKISGSALDALVSKPIKQN